MKRTWTMVQWVALMGVAAAMIVMAVARGQQTQPASMPASRPAGPFETPAQTLSYSVGVEMARSLQRQGIEIDVDLFARGMRDVQAGPAARLMLSDKEINAALAEGKLAVRRQQMEAAKAATEANRKQGEAFLAANKTREGVVTLPSGLQYKVLKAGQGKKPAGTDTVECHYRGTLIDGTEFDSSYSRGAPAAFKVSGLIAGWTEALQLMPVGSKWQLFIPSALAYGPRGAGRTIGPNATLVFELELLAIK